MRIRLPRSGRARVAVLAVALVVGANLLLVAVDALLPSPSGPPSSSYATTTRGAAGLADLLERSGHPVRRSRELPGEGRLDPRATTVLLEPDLLLAAEARALRRHVARGGRLVIGGGNPDRWLGELLGRDVGWRGAAAGEYRAALPVAGLPRLERVRSAGEGAFADADGSLPALVSEGGDRLLLAAPVGRGTVLLLADASPLQNRLLGAADNAELALGLAGEEGRPVEFVEAVHGYGEARGLGALPSDWRWALLGLGIAALLFLAARARRLGPPDPEPPRAVPSRRLYVEALAAALERTGDPAAAAPVRDAARERLRRRFRLPPDAPAEELLRAGSRAGLTDDEARALAHPPGNDSDVLAAGRAFARLDKVRGE